MTANSPSTASRKRKKCQWDSCVNTMQVSRKTNTSSHSRTTNINTTQFITFSPYSKSQDTRSSSTTPLSLQWHRNTFKISLYVCCMSRVVCRLFEWPDNVINATILAWRPACSAGSFASYQTSIPTPARLHAGVTQLQEFQNREN